MHAFDLERLAGRQLCARRARAGERIRTLDGEDRAARRGHARHRRRRRAAGHRRRDGRRRLGGLGRHPPDRVRERVLPARERPAHQPPPRPQDGGLVALRARHRHQRAGRGPRARVRAARADRRRSPYGRRHRRLPGTARPRRDPASPRPDRPPAGRRRGRLRGRAHLRGPWVRRGGRPGRLARPRADDARGRAAGGGPHRRSGAPPWVRSRAANLPGAARHLAAPRAAHRAEEPAAPRAHRRRVLGSRHLVVHRRVRRRAVRRSRRAAGPAGVSAVGEVRGAAPVTAARPGRERGAQPAPRQARRQAVRDRRVRVAHPRRAAPHRLCPDRGRAWPNTGAAATGSSTSSTPGAWSNASARRCGCRSPSPRRQARSCSRAAPRPALPVARNWASSASCCRPWRKPEGSQAATRSTSRSSTSTPSSGWFRTATRSSRPWPASPRSCATSRSSSPNACAPSRCARPSAAPRPRRWPRCASSTATRARASLRVRYSLSLRLTFRSPERTLTDVDVQAAMGGIMEALAREHQAVQR